MSDFLQDIYDNELFVPAMWFFIGATMLAWIFKLLPEKRNVNATPEQKIEIKQIIVGLRESIINYRPYDSIKNDVEDKLSKLQDYIKIADNEETVQLFRDLENAVLCVFSLKKEKNRPLEQEADKARVVEYSGKLLKLIG
ncbi:MAG: hypothetical protein V3U60_16385 [Gammaproteobacteria bacterium]